MQILLWRFFMIKWQGCNIIIWSTGQQCRFNFQRKLSIILDIQSWTFKHFLWVNNRARKIYWCALFTVHTGKIHFACALKFYLFKANNRNTRKRCELCSKLTIKTRHWRRSGIFIVNFEHIYFTSFSSAFIVDFEQLNVSWVITWKLDTMTTLFQETKKKNYLMG